MIEKEFKLHVPDLDQIKTKLSELNPNKGDRVHELTVMFDNKERIMENMDARLRVRKRTKTTGDIKVSLSFKLPLSRARIKQEIEYETGVNNPEATEKLLEAMGFFPVSSYERYRTTYTILGQGKVVYVDLDELPFGNYVEVEGEDIELMEGIVRSLGLDPRNHIEKSYDGIYQQIEENKNSASHIRFK